MLVPFHVAEEVTRSPFGVQTRQNLDSALAASDVLVGTAEKKRAVSIPVLPAVVFVVPLLFPSAGFVLLALLSDESIAWVATGLLRQKGFRNAPRELV
jgi:hypothetical protein